MKPLNEGRKPNTNGNSIKMNTESIPHAKPIFCKSLSNRKKKDTSTNTEIGKVSAKAVRRLGAPCQSMLPIPVIKVIIGRDLIAEFLMRLALTRRYAKNAEIRIAIFEVVLIGWVSNKPMPLSQYVDSPLCKISKIPNAI